MKKEMKTVAALPTLAALEQEVVTAYRELGRQELERRLQQLAAHAGELSPPAATQTPDADPAHGTGPGQAGHGLRTRPADASMVLSATAGVGADAASKDYAGTGRQAVLHGGRHHVL